MSIQPKNGITVSLSTLLEGENVAPFRNANIAVCSCNAYEPLDGGLYVCKETDPAAALEDVKIAAANGAVAVVLPNALDDAFAEEQWAENADNESGFQKIFVDDPRSVYARACQAFRDFPARKMRTVAVTGTAGKTSLSYILGGVLAEAGQSVGLISSIGVYDGVKLRPSKETTPEPEELAELLDKMVEFGCQCAIIETSSVAIAEKRIAGIEFDAVCLTNLRRDHLDVHRTVDQYRRVKMQIFNYLKKNGVAICNLDDRVTDAALHLINRPTLTVGTQPTSCSVSGTPVERSVSGQTFYIVAGADACPIRTQIIGKEHIYNCLEAAALAIAWKIDLKTVAKGIERVTYIPGRMERIDCGQPYDLFLDRASSPESLAAALDALRRVTTGSLYCVLAAPDDGDRSKRPLLGRTAETNADYTIVTSGNHPQSQTEEAFEDLIKGFEKADEVHVIKDRKEAILWILSHASPDDCVLIVGQDVSTLDKINEKFLPDRQFIKHWLYENQPCVETFWYN
ncbi:MAG: UDP-N-acetylmuramyl-tripeptide synthetase [Thermoguttaceae bacterium]|jgi:UDP-N-acetylmuramoyl-L-alanyl-D-glutamate--2,6-diaminopimelate ligase|nr:UDP-N-acetylmuramyl-tripeptide synthetase [Thermoguttaceae bacterium]